MELIKGKEYEWTRFGKKVKGVYIGMSDGRYVFRSSSACAYYLTDKLLIGYQLHESDNTTIYTFYRFLQ